MCCNSQTNAELSLTDIIFNAQVTDICEVEVSYGICKSEHEIIHLFSTVVSDTKAC